MKVNGADLTKLRKAVSGTAADLRTAFTTLMTDLGKLGISPGGKVAASSLEQRLIAKQASVATQTTRLNAMKDYRATTISTLRGAYDPTQAGSADDLVTGLTGATGTNNTFTKELASLRNRTKKNPVLAAFVNRLAASGQTTTLQTLFGASSGQLARITKADAGYESSLTGAGNQAVTNAYGESVAHQTSDVQALTHQVGQLYDAVHDLALAVGTGRPINLDGREVGR